MPACGMMVVSYGTREKLDRVNGLDNINNDFGQVSVPMATIAVLESSPVSDPQSMCRSFCP